MRADPYKRVVVYESDEFLQLRREGWSVLGVERAKPNGPLMAVMLDSQRRPIPMEAVDEGGQA